MNIFDDGKSINSLGNIYLKNWKVIVYTVIACTIISVVVTLLLTPRYRAKSSFFIPYSISYDQAIENPQFGYDLEADRVLQVLHSDQLKDSVIKQFNLLEYYDIDTTNYDWKVQLSEKFGRRVISNRTNVMSIVVEAETHDPYFSTEIVKYMVGLAQRMRERILKSNSAIAVEAFRKEYMKKAEEVDSLRKRIMFFRKETKNSRFSLVNSQTLLGGERIPSLSPETDVELEVLTQKHINEHNRLNDLKGKYENALNTHNRAIPKFYILDDATPVFKKVFPVAGLNIAVGFFGSLFLMLAGIYLKQVVVAIKQYTNT